MLRIIKSHWLFLLPLAVFVGYYTFQNIIGFAHYPHETVMTFVTALALSAISYTLTYLYFPVGWADSLSSRSPTPEQLERACLWIVATFAVVIVVACLTTDRIPLVEALTGASAGQLFEDRANFLRERTGAGQILNYAFAILSQAVMPLALTYAFWARTSWRRWALVIFTVGTFLTLSKAAFLCVSAPLIALFCMQGRWRAAAGAVASFVASVAVMYVLASGIVGVWIEKADTAIMAVQQGQSFGDPLGKAKAVTASSKSVPSNQVALPSDTPMEYNVFGKRTALLVVANRIVWIPYVTALDWFKYQEVKLHGDYVYGRSIRPIAFAMGEKRLYLEKAVAELQWGCANCATSNAVFFADAWLNWGPLGVILYSALFALTIKLIATSGYLPLVAASVLPVWIACFSALPPVYFSGGLGLLALAALAIRKRALVP